MTENKNEDVADVLDSHGNLLTHQQRLRGGLICNIAGLFGTLGNYFAVPSVALFVTLMMKEWLGATMTQVGILVAIGSLGPIWEMIGAQIVERIGRRKPFFVALSLISKIALIFVALIPFLGRSSYALKIGLTVVYSVTIITRISGHLVTPAFLSWLGDLIPEDYRGRFFGRRMQWSMAGMGLYVAGSMMIDHFGGMNSPTVIALVVGIGAVFALSEILLFFRVPEPKMIKGQLKYSLSEVVLWVTRPFKRPDFRMMVLSLGLGSFVGMGSVASSPYITLYLRGGDFGGHTLGFNASFTYLSFVMLAFSAGCIVSGKYWGVLGDRIRPKYVLCIGFMQVLPSLILFFLNTTNYKMPILIASFVNGILFSAFSVGHQHLIYEVTPKEYRSFYLAANSMGLAIFGAVFHYIAGKISDFYPVLSWTLPNGNTWTYMHLLLLLAYGSALVSTILCWLIKPIDKRVEIKKIEQMITTDAENLNPCP